MNFPDWPSFPFYVRNFLTSRAVARMSPTARGGYVMLLCHAWDSERPGWLRDDDEELATLSGLGPTAWEACRESIARAFAVRRGWWVQVFMLQVKRRLMTDRRRKIRGAKATNEIRNRKRLIKMSTANAQRTHSVRTKRAQRTLSIAVAVEEEPTEKPVSQSHSLGSGFDASADLTPTDASPPPTTEPDEPGAPAEPPTDSLHKDWTPRVLTSRLGLTPISEVLPSVIQPLTRDQVAELVAQRPSEVLFPHELNESDEDHAERVRRQVEAWREAGCPE